MFRILTAMALIFSVNAFAKEDKYTRHFVNPVEDNRFNFTSCMVEGALFGILNNEIGDVVCWGPMKTDTSKEPTIFYVYKGTNRKTQDYFVQTRYEFWRGAGEQESGIQIYKVGLKEVDSKTLDSDKKSKQSTLQISQSWFYSDGVTLLIGKLPGKTKKLNSPVYFLGTIDEELAQFADELDSN